MPAKEVTRLIFQTSYFFGRHLTNRITSLAAVLPSELLLWQRSYQLNYLISALPRRYTKYSLFWKWKINWYTYTSKFITSFSYNLNYITWWITDMHFVKVDLLMYSNCVRIYNTTINEEYKYYIYTITINIRWKSRQNEYFV